VQFELVILDWAAYAAGQQQEWLDWAVSPSPWPATLVDTVPALPEMPAMMRRRVDRLGRLACQVAYWCQQQSAAGEVPMVFASRYGDASRSLALLGDLSNQVDLSPTGFGLSVHNAVSALYSIARADTQNAVVVSAGRATVLAALTEAAGLLADGAPEVLVVYYEAPLPGDYGVFQDEPACEYAWSWRVARAGSPLANGQAGKVKLTLNAEGQAADPAPSDLQGAPVGLLALRHMLQQWAAPSSDQTPTHSWLRTGHGATRCSWSPLHA
jgi:hypothetical protein